MSRAAHGQVRRSQVITTWGPGRADRPAETLGDRRRARDWPKVDELEEIVEPRLTRKLALMTGRREPAAVRATRRRDGARRADARDRRLAVPGVVGRPGAGRQATSASASRRLVHRKALDDKGRSTAATVVPTRFVRACPRGHVDDLDWHRFVHGAGRCLPAAAVARRARHRRRPRRPRRALRVRQVARACTRRPSSSIKPLGHVPRARGRGSGSARQEECRLPSRLLIRTAANAYFPQVMSALSLPEHGSRGRRTRSGELWDDLQIVDERGELPFMKKKPKVAAKLAGYSDDDVLGGDREAQARRRRRAAGQAGRARRAARRARGLRRRRARSTPTSTPAGCRTQSGDARR